MAGCSKRMVDPATGMPNRVIVAITKVIPSAAERSPRRYATTTAVVPITTSAHGITIHSASNGMWPVYRLSIGRVPQWPIDWDVTPSTDGRIR